MRAWMVVGLSLAVFGCAKEEEPAPVDSAVDWGVCGQPVVEVSLGFSGFDPDIPAEIELFYDGATFYTTASFRINGYPSLEVYPSMVRVSDGVVVTPFSETASIGSPTDDECIFEGAGIRIIPSEVPASELPEGPNGLVVLEWTCDQLGKEFQVCLAVNDADDPYDDDHSGCFEGVLVHRGTGCDIF